MQLPPEMIDGKSLFKALENADIITDADQVEAVRITAEPHKPVRIEVHLFAGPSLCLALSDLSKDCE